MKEKDKFSNKMAIKSLDEFHAPTQPWSWIKPSGRAQRDSGETSVASEYQEQAAVITWWGWNCKRWGLDERLLYAVPNGAHLAGGARERAIQMKKLKTQGLRPGAPDLMLAHPVLFIANEIDSYHTMKFAGLYVEMKRRNGKPSQAQREFADLLRRQGYNVVIAQGADEAIRAIEAYLGK